MVIIYFALYDKCGLGKPSKWYIDLAAQVTIHNSDSVLKHEFHPTNFTSFSNTTSLSPCDQFDVSIGDEYTTSLIFSIVLYASSKSWDKFATRAYTLYSDMGDDTESECSSADEELFTSTSSSNTITTPNLAHVTDDKQVKNQSTTANPGAQTSAKKPYKGKNLPIPEATQILTGYKGADDQQEQVRDIIVYDIPYTWDVEKILGELTLWGHTIKFFQYWSHSLALEGLALVLPYFHPVRMGTPEVSIGWSWVQIHDLHLNSVATYAHGTVKHWPSSSHAEAAAIYAALSSVPNGAKANTLTFSSPAQFSSNINNVLAMWARKYHAIKPKVQTKTQSNQKIPILGEFLKDLKLEKLSNNQVYCHYCDTGTPII
ncbi:hypothetical protein RhiirA5_402719 [Rhizophagus irregularis]|uniref:Uncharacterized protein n=1 Tax=Rhizophagus irregularis TaxID=588596 RepID=A0A2N0P4C6_9GLOM|nr:hypothetical protein RhiirA5_402719 [Rhizophagus irregularis]